MKSMSVEEKGKHMFERLRMARDELMFGKYWKEDCDETGMI